MKIDSEYIIEEVWVKFDGSLMVYQWKNRSLLGDFISSEIRRVLQACGAELLGYL